MNRRRKTFSLIAFGMLIFAFAFGVSFLVGRKRPLSASESRLVGRWTEGGGSRKFVYSADRTFRSSDGQFAGTWSIDGSKLLLRYWQNDHPPSDLRERFELVKKRMQAHGESWNIDFAENENVVTLMVPDNSAVLTRLPGS
jgi:hypothetical protein